MGKRVAGSDKTEGASEQRNAESSGTTNTENEGNGGRGQYPARTKEKTKLPKVVPVEVPGQENMSEEEKKAEEKRAKDRERKAKSRASGNVTKTRTKAKTKTSAMELLQIKAMLMTVSQIASTRPGMEMWVLTDEEASAIVEPLSNMMAKSQVMEAVGENSDTIALVIACFTIFVPKFLTWNTMRKQTKKQEVTNYARPNQVTGTSGRNETGKVGTSPRHGSGQTTVSSQTFSGDISSLIPASPML